MKPLKSFMQRFSFRLPKQRVKIVASTRCSCCQLLLLLSVFVASCCCCCCCLGLLNCCCCAKSLPRATANSKGSSRSRRRMQRASLQAKQTAAIFMLPSFCVPFSLSLLLFFVVLPLFLLLFLHLINGVSMESFPPCGRREKS